MFRKSGIIAAIAAACLQESLALEQVETPVNLSLIDEIGTSPCIFKLDSKFYDFTPIKLKYPDPVAPYVDGSINVTSDELRNADKHFVFGWCQRLEDVPEQTLCQEPFFAGRVDGENPTEETPCYQYSGGNVSNQIETEVISGYPLTSDLVGSNDVELPGVALKYIGGTYCED